MVQSTIRTETLFKSVLLSQGNGLELIVPKKLNSTGIFLKKRNLEKEIRNYLSNYLFLII